MSKKNAGAPNKYSNQLLLEKLSEYLNDHPVATVNYLSLIHI